ncbi:MAG TPA: hypothetical protein VGR53_03575 [Nitrososphaerales archaeon]|nr:hypothetical protein [Nitrososphaerales archaeon]
MVKCETCGKEFATEGALTQHLKDKHGVTGTLDVMKPSEAKERRQETRTKPRSLRKRNRHPVAIGVAAAAVVIGLGLYLVVAPSFTATPFPCAAEGNYIHVHPYLQIWIDGKNVTIPAEIGITQSGSCLEPLHTHDSYGIIHVELSKAEANKTWTLGDFFSIWKYTCNLQPAQCPTVNGTSRPVVFDQSNILGFTADSSHKVTLLVNGVPSSAGGSLDLEQYDYCYAAISNAPPCSPTAGGDPAWNVISNTQHGTYPYSTGNKIIIEFSSV